jgi:hypothetical protein
MGTLLRRYIEYDFGYDRMMEKITCDPVVESILRLGGGCIFLANPVLCLKVCLFLNDYKEFCDPGVIMAQF